MIGKVVFGSNVGDSNDDVVLGQPVEGVAESIAERLSAGSTTFDSRNHGSVVNSEVDVLEVEQNFLEGGATVVESIGFKFGDDTIFVARIFLLPFAAGAEDLTSGGDENGAPTVERSINVDGAVGKWRASRFEILAVSDGAPVVEFLENGRGDHNFLVGREFAAIHLVELATSPLDGEDVVDQRDSEETGGVDQATDERFVILGEDVGGHLRWNLLGEFGAEGNGVLVVIEGATEEDVLFCGGEGLLEGDTEGRGVIADFNTGVFNGGLRTSDTKIIDEGVLSDRLDSKLRFDEGGVSGEDFHGSLHDLDGRRDTHGEASHLKETTLRIDETVPTPSFFGNQELIETRSGVAAGSGLMFDGVQVKGDVTKIGFAYVFVSEPFVETFRPKDETKTRL